MPNVFTERDVKEVLEKITKDVPIIIELFNKLFWPKDD